MTSSPSAPHLYLILSGALPHFLSCILTILFRFQLCRHHRWHIPLRALRPSTTERTISIIAGPDSIAPPGPARSLPRRNRHGRSPPHLIKQRNASPRSPYGSSVSDDASSPTGPRCSRTLPTRPPRRHRRSLVVRHLAAAAVPRHTDGNRAGLYEFGVDHTSASYSNVISI